MGSPYTVLTCPRADRWIRGVAGVLYIWGLFSLWRLVFPSDGMAGPLGPKLDSTVINALVFAAISLLLLVPTPAGTPLIGNVALSVQLVIATSVFLLLLMFFSSSSPVGPHEISPGMFPTYWYLLLQHYAAVVMFIWQPIIAIWRNASRSPRTRTVLTSVLLLTTPLFFLLALELFHLNYTG
ncbi:hypothetical protein D9V34_00975 [Mycetocola lacteus]|uniref:Uncharacterized protein n=1 Tax=Mycetocola lacteus TaxID=76637 RepID=A0A3L7AVN8_9MICO|nr:hypothetical protein [Mycetocola lacteus]RLP80818.1 hypothetical protein D9V34_13270 [Mycetocola lacteus]RLP84603.1 hypothetical protein D9V34_00975 [Mycetocola lacteus]